MRNPDKAGPPTSPRTQSTNMGAVEEVRTTLSGGIDTSIDTIAKSKNPLLLSAFNVKIK
jgi:hypothetical protein